MPFGLKNVVGVFSRMIRTLLEPLDRTDILNFMDDILIASDSWEQHLEALNLVFSRLEQAGLTARPTKCFLGCEELEYLGHKVGRGQMWQEESKLEKIQNVHATTTKCEVRV